MFMFDIETLGVESTTVILSIACIHFNPEEKPTFQQLIDSAFFVKLDAKDQVKRLGRTVSKSTLDWWSGQHVAVKKKSFDPSDTDVKAEYAVEMLNTWVKQFPEWEKSTVWARGSLDQMAYGSLENRLGVDPIFHFARWRDVRTAVDIFTGSTNGYCKVEHPEFENYLVVKHDPIHDCALDVMMLVYGK